MHEAWVNDRFRGQRIASELIRVGLREAMISLGRCKFYSMIECFNTPSLRAASKSALKRVKLGVYIKLFNRYRWTIALRQYRRQAPPLADFQVSRNTVAPV